MPSAFSQQFQRIGDQVLGWSTRPRIFFCHVPKCAGTSIIKAIRRATYPCGVVPRFSIDLHAAHRAAILLNVPDIDIRVSTLAYCLARERYRLGSGHVPCPPGVVTNYGSDWDFVTVLRDPVTRWISNFVYNTGKPDQWMKNTLSIEDYLESEQSWSDGCVMVRYFSKFPDNVMDVENLSCAAEAVENLRRFTLVGRVEEFESWESEFNRRYSANIRVVKGNSTPDADAVREIRSSSELMAEIRERCRPDTYVYDTLFSGRRVGSD